MSEEERKEFKQLWEESRFGGCSTTMVIVILSIMLLCGCRTVRETEASVDDHRYTELMAMMDSAFGSSKTILYDIMARQTSLVESFSQQQRRDSSYMAVVNERGDTIRERIEIYHEVEKDHASEKKETEYWMHLFHRTDSMLREVSAMQHRTDSLLRTREKVSEKQLTKWQSLKANYGGWAMGILAFIVVLFIATGSFWKRLVKVLRTF